MWNHEYEVLLYLFYGIQIFTCVYVCMYTCFNLITFFFLMYFYTNI